MSASLHLTRPHLGLSAAAHRRTSLFLRLVDAVALHRQRQHLSKLDDTLLADIGLTREQARHEAERPVWDVPSLRNC